MHCGGPNITGSSPTLGGYVFEQLATAWISNEPFLDTPKLLEHGASPMTVFLYCTVTIGFGYFGFRRSCQNVLSNGPVQQREINAELPKP